MIIQAGSPQPSRIRIFNQRFRNHVKSNICSYSIVLFIVFECFFGLSVGFLLSGFLPGYSTLECVVSECENANKGFVLKSLVKSSEGSNYYIRSVYVDQACPAPVGETIVCYNTSKDSRLLLSLPEEDSSKVYLKIFGFVNLFLFVVFCALFYLVRFVNVWCRGILYKVGYCDWNSMILSLLDQSTRKKLI